MNLNTLKAFRHAILGCFGQAKDALFNTIDALLSEDRAHSFPELSLSPFFERRWPSLYEAFEDGRIQHSQLRKVFVAFVPRPPVESPLWIGIDTSGIARPRSVTSADRNAQFVHNLPECEKPVTYGWQFSTVVVLPEPASSWTYLLDQQRVSTDTTASHLAFAQLSALAPSLPDHTIAVLDRAYDLTWLWCQCSTLPLEGTLVRLKGNRCLYRQAPTPTRKRGAPRKDGDKLQPNDLQSHGNPSGQWQGSDDRERPLEITWWQHLHLKDARWLDLAVMRVVRPHASNKERDPRVSWFLWIGNPDVDLVKVASGYVRRFSQEHGYRFDKQSLLWDKPRLRTPEQFERWSHIVAIAHNHLVLARDLVAAELRPWERTQRDPTPQHVRRAMSKLLPQLGTPARAPQPRGKSPGRAKGVKIGKAKRFSVVRKVPKLPPLVPL
ncbi:MAG TPA: NF041680 family putative transposase [Ktedonobacteraceae bacterium]|nr:NF041680 family putative transposase [Ktedonobacteraceae bacterium]